MQQHRKLRGKSIVKSRLPSAGLPKSIWPICAMKRMLKKSVHTFECGISVSWDDKHFYVRWLAPSWLYSPLQACTNCVKKALEFDPESYSAMQTMASISISACEPAEALDWMNRSLALWHNPNTPEITGEVPETGEPSEARMLPPFDQRISAAKVRWHVLYFWGLFIVDKDSACGFSLDSVGTPSTRTSNRSWFWLMSNREINAKALFIRCYLICKLRMMK